jgi:cell division protein YceG involved in septum cleavage
MNSDYLKLYIKFNNPEYSLKVGKFEIQENANITEVLAALQKPIFNTQNITLLE